MSTTSTWDFTYSSYLMPTKCFFIFKMTLFLGQLHDLVLMYAYVNYCVAASLLYANHMLVYLTYVQYFSITALWAFENCILAVHVWNSTFYEFNNI